MMITDFLEINAINTTNEIKKLVLFGRNPFLFEPNYGSDKGVNVKAGCDWITYPHLLLSNFFENSCLHRIKVITEDTTQLDSDETEIMEMINLEETGYRISNPIRVRVDENQLNKNIVIIQPKKDSNIKITHNTYFEYYLLPKAKVSFIFSRKINQKKSFWKRLFKIK